MRLWDFPLVEVEIGASYYFSATEKEIELLQTENEHLTTDQLNTVSNKKNKKHCAQDSNRVHQSSLSLTHTSMNPTTGSACTQKRITPAFYWPAQPGLETYWSADVWQAGRAVSWFFFFPGFEIKQTAQPIPEERRYRQTKRTSGGAGVHKKNRTEPTPMWISLTESLTTTVPWLLHRTVSPPVGRGAKREEDTLSLKQKKSQLLWSLTNGGHPSTVQYHIS